MVKNFFLMVIKEEMMSLWGTFNSGRPILEDLRLKYYDFNHKTYKITDSFNWENNFWFCYIVRVASEQGILHF